MNFKVFVLLAVLVFASAAFAAESEITEPEVPRPDTMGKFYLVWFVKAIVFNHILCNSNLGYVPNVPE